VPAAGFRRDNLVADVIVTQISRLRPGTDFSSARTGCDVEESGTAGNRRRTATDLHGREGAIGVEPARSETTIGSDGGAIVELGIACPIRRQQRAIVERFVPVVEFAVVGRTTPIIARRDVDAGRSSVQLQAEPAIGAELVETGI